ncbi:MAG TPA: UDP-N-acetylmuramate dehydrogenase [Candidatus Ornithomonoglobus intestinigallinarum]|uniref:UDP-N-acetylenolpyruvoylglucosamine reductase n=1 Tax=Candidatus Ornithomonoglobus intestinigallinarum TaxID=2840894 RepID=A0A9D1KQP1_9FIRM|nr:UDP-N-acetylmuramate dehydrogenase [Candidatus Ornithomonoglobus intestinigallinarum]
MTDRTKISALAKNVKFDEPMSAHTTFKIGGPADVFVDAENADEIKSVMRYCGENSVPLLITGNGSNMLVGDRGIRGVVVSVGKKMSKIEVDGERITAEAGALMSSVAAAALKAELSGFETLSGIPGTVGGGIYMNAGAYGGEIKDVLETVTYIDRDGSVKTAKAEELDLSYRHSMFEEGGYVILSCVLKLKPGNADEIKAAMRDYSKRRSDKQPISMPSAGSTFKRPEGYFAGKLIQDSGLMGKSVGGAQVSEKHAGFVVNTGGATAADVLELIRLVQDTVEEKFGVRLEPEVRLIGEQ